MFSVAKKTGFRYICVKKRPLEMHNCGFGNVFWAFGNVFSVFWYSSFFGKKRVFADSGGNARLVDLNDRHWGIATIYCGGGLVVAVPGASRERLSHT